jgi:two-component system OmpR family response regulator
MRYQQTLSAGSGEMGTVSEILLQTPRVLVIEDDPDVGEAMQRVIQHAGMQTELARNRVEAVELKRTFAPDVVLVDLQLPDTSGAALVQWLAKLEDCGIIIVSGSTEEAERIVGLELGADDFIAKPPHMREMIARIRAVHRRTSAIRPTATAQMSQGAVFNVGPLRVDTRRRSVSDSEGHVLPITAAEFTALQVLLEANGQPVSRERLSEVALRRPWRAEDRSTDQLIFSLRRKIGDEDREPRLSQSVRGAGYVLARDVN